MFDRSESLARLEQQADARAAHMAKVRAALAPEMSEEKFALVYSYAWDDYHPYGLDDVEAAVGDLLTLFRALQDTTP